MMACLIARTDLVLYAQRNALRFIDLKGRQLFETTHLFWDGNTTSGLQTQTLNVWYIYLHLVDFYDKWW